MKKVIFIMVVGFAIQSCSPKIRSSLTANNFSAIEEETEIMVLKDQITIPKNSQLVGDLKIGDSGFSTDCGYDIVIEKAKLTARKSGANLIQITELKPPDFNSTCYRIKAKMYRNLDPTNLSALADEQKIQNKSRLPADADYSIVYFYRPKNIVGFAIGYKIRDENDKVIGRVRNGEKFAFRTSNFGKQTFYGKTESKDSVVIDIQRGQEYFVRCGIGVGIAVGRPDLHIAETDLGIKEYEEMK